MRKCWYGADQGERCKNVAQWQYTIKAMLEEPLLPRETVWCDEHRAGMEGETTAINYEVAGR